MRLGALCFGAAVIGASCGGPGGSGGPGHDAGPAADAAVADATTRTMLDASDEALADTTVDVSAEASSDSSADAVSEAASDGSASDGGPDSGEGGGGANQFIVVDQFGYRTSAEKIAVIRSPQTGVDATSSFAPGSLVALVDAHSNQKLVEAAPVAWNGGATDTSSGDKAWWFDFSAVTTPGDYFVLDEASGTRSGGFRIADDVYSGVLKRAVRMFYYQRDGIAKDAQYAGAAWADGMAHPQDATCGLFTDGSALKDLHGGWFDAGDQNKYAGWTASNAIELLRAYTENPGAFHDDTGIPESGNGVPDILDEVKWGLDWALRMQNVDGSVLSLVSHAGADPPSSDTSACRYGPPSTSVTWSAAAAFADAAIVFKSVSAASTAYPGYADSLAASAQSAWTWAVANPGVTFSNLTNGLGAREQEVGAAGLVARRVEAAVFLFELTGNATFASVVDANFTQVQTALDPLDMRPSESLLEYAKAPAATPSVVQSITSTFKSGVEGSSFFGASQSNKDPYLAYLQTYPWGSNKAKSGQGNMFYDVVTFNIDASAGAAAKSYAERYLHYLHGVNPLQLVYLSNMSADGAETSVTNLFTVWFWQGSKYAAPPGFLVAGPNPGYTWDICCPSSCGSPGNDALCGQAPLSPPAAQPSQKSYKDFNDRWPLDSWFVSEPNDAYQAEYLRLLSKFVP